MKRVAIQYYGLLRGFRFEETRDAIYKHIILKLVEYGYEVDIFIHTYDKEFDDVILKLDKKHFPIRSITIDSDDAIDNYISNNIINKFKFYNHWTRDHKYGWFKFTNSMAKCTNKRREYEAQYGINYEWIIITSPQIKPIIDLDDLRLYDNNYMYSPNYAKFGGYYTSFFIGSPDHINYIGELYEFMITLNYKNSHMATKYPLDNNLIDSEPIFKGYIDMKYIMKDIMEIRFNRIRYDGTIVNN